MANERVSQLTEIVSSEMSPNDLFLVTDTSARESKKLQATELLAYIEASASIVNVVHAVTSDTASYILGSNVDGAVDSSSYSIHSDTASLADRALTADTAISAAYAPFAALMTVDTASFLASPSPGSSNGTASAAISASFANSASRAIGSDSTLFLVYLGGNNGTASYAISCSAAINAANARSASFSDRTVSSSFTTSASYARSASNADTASYIPPSLIPLPTFVEPPIVLASGTLAIGLITLDVSPYVSSNATVAMLDCYVANNSTNTLGFIYVRKNSSTTSLILTAFKSGGDEDDVASGGQGMVPLTAAKTFQYTVTQNTSGWRIRLIGYI